MDNIGFSIGGDCGASACPPAKSWLTSRATPLGHLHHGERFQPHRVRQLHGPAHVPRERRTPVRWVQNTNAEVDAKNHVYEFALEFNIPLLKEVPGFQDLSANLAGRYSKYSTFDAVESWKAGLNWQIIDSLRFRGTLSSDIRAPTLNDLYQPPA
jgi:hypothetical protein